MKTYIKERCSNPRAYYKSAQDVLDDDVLKPSEKEFVLKSMAAEAELFADEEAETAFDVGEQPPTIWAIHSALSELGQPHGFPETTGADSARTGDVQHVIAAMSGNSDVDLAVDGAARRVAQLTGARIQYVSVVPNATAPVAHGTLTAVVPTMGASDAGFRRVEAEADARKKILHEFIERNSAPNNCAIDVKIGFADEEILKAADECNASLIIVGSGEHTWLEGILSSDVARQVSKKATCPVLVIPETNEEC